jgi:hypothetical protein
MACAACVLLSAALLIQFRVMHHDSTTQLQALIFSESKTASPGIILAAIGFALSFGFAGRAKVAAVILSLVVLVFWF